MEEAQTPLHETMRLAEAQLVRHEPGGTALKHCKIQSRRDALKVAILEAPCAQNALGRSTMRPPEALLPPKPYFFFFWEPSHFSGLTILGDPPAGGRVKMEPFVLLPFFSCFVVTFGQFEANACYEAKRDLVGCPLLYRHFGCLGVLEAKIRHMSFRNGKCLILRRKVL